MERKALFERGDIILDLDKKEPRLILSVTDDGWYEFMELGDQCWHDIFGTDISIKKGETGKQPCDIVEKNFSIYKIE